MIAKNKNKNYFPPIIIGALIFVFYLICMPKTVVLEDDGLFILSSYFNGVSHPPGYPLHSLLGYLFAHLPVGNPAANVHALSAFFSALSASLIYIITSQLTIKSPTRNLTTFIAVAAYTFSSEIWSQSIIAEVYTLNVFLFLYTLYIALIIHSSLENKNLQNQPGSVGSLKLNIFFLGLVSGLALANHWPLFILGFLGIFFLLLNDFKHIAKYWSFILIGVFIGLTPYLWLYLNSNSDTLIKFHGSLETFNDFFKYISRQNFNKTTDFSFTATGLDKIYFFFFTLKQLVNQWGNINSIFIPLGIIIIYKENLIQRCIINGMLISYFSSSLLLSIILGYDFNDYKKVDFLPFLILSHTLGAIFFAYGVTYLLKLVQTISTKNFKVIVISTIAFQTITANASKNYRANYIWTTIYVKAILNTLKPNSTLFVSGDISTGVIGYWHFIKNHRPDITVIHDKGLVISGTRLFNPKDGHRKARKKIIKKYIETSNTPSYFINNEFNFGVNNHWLLYEYNRELQDGQQLLQSLANTNERYFHYVFSDTELTDKWTIKHRDNLRFRAITHLVSEISSETSQLKFKKIIKYLSVVNRKLQGLTITLLIAHEQNKMNSIDPENILIETGWKLYELEENKRTKAAFLNLLAHFEAESGNSAKSRSLYFKSLDIWNHQDNIAHQKLLN